MQTIPGIQVTRAGVTIGAVFLLLALIAIAHTSYTNWFSAPSDTVAYWDAGERIWRGVSLYDNPDPHRVNRPYIYPPAFAAAFSLLVPLGSSRGLAFWSASHVLLLLLILVLLRRRAGLRRDKLAFMLPLLLPLLLFVPLAQELYEGQVNLLVTALVLCGLLAAGNGRSRTGGLLLAAAAHVKVLPGVAILFLLARRQFTAAAWMAAGLLAFVLVPWPFAAAELGPWDGLVYALEQYWRWSTDVVWTAVSFRQVGGMEYLGSPNIAMAAVLARLFCLELNVEPGVAVAAGRSLSHLVTAALLAVSLWAAWRKRGGEFAALAWPSLAIVALQLGNVICWGHHLVLLAIPATVAWCASGVCRRRWLWFIAAAPLAIFASLPSLVGNLASGTTRKTAADYLDQSVYWGVPAWGALMVWGLCACILLAQDRRPALPQTVGGHPAETSGQEL